MSSKTLKKHKIHPVYCTRVESDSIPTTGISHFHCSDHKHSRTCSNNLEQSENVEPNTTKSRNLWYCHRTKLTSRAGNNVYYSTKMENKECFKLLIRIGHKKSGGRGETKVLKKKCFTVLGWTGVWFSFLSTIGQAEERNLIMIAVYQDLFLSFHVHLKTEHIHTSSYITSRSACSISQNGICVKL
jgi:hypothetical protein